MRVPRFPLTAPVMVESDVKVNTEVVGVSAVGVTALALPLNEPEMSPGRCLRCTIPPATGTPAGDGMLGVPAADLEAPGLGSRLTGGERQRGHDRDAGDDNAADLAG